MNYPNLSLVDLVTFDAIRRIGSINGAAVELDIAQPTLSNRLRNMRKQLGDPLFVRTKKGMLPTQFAAQLGPHVAGALSQIEQGISHRETFDPAQLKRNFTIVMSDLTEIIVLPVLMKKCRQIAPGVSFSTISVSETELDNTLSSGLADLALGYFPAVSPGLIQRHVVNTTYACIVAANHPWLTDELTIEQYFRAQHAITEGKGIKNLSLERAISATGRSISVGVRVSGFLSLPMIVVDSDMIATVPQKLAQLMVRANIGIKMLPHPLNPEPYEVRQIWHSRSHHDTGNMWLRSVLNEIYTAVNQDSGVNTDLALAP